MNNDLDLTKFPYGICPFMSGQLAPISGPGGIIPPGQNIAISSINLPCVGDKCQMWFEGSCSLRKLVAIAPQLDNIAFHLSNISCHMELPKNGSSPMMRIADALEALIPKKK